MTTPKRPKIKPVCPVCGDNFAAKRQAAGYRLCLPCGEEQARVDRQSWCVAPMHKSNYMLFTPSTAKQDLAGINNKGGLVK